MVFFSWTTSDTKTAIRHIHAEEDCRTVYLLQPSGEHIKETAYEGYGMFGGVDAYTWLAKMNLPQESLTGFSEKELRSVGINLQHGDLLKTHDGKLHALFHGGEKMFKAMGLNVEAFQGRWDGSIPGLGTSANELVANGPAMTVRIGELFPLRYPLKFSFNPDADYDALPAAEDDPNQGF